MVNHYTGSIVPGKDIIFVFGSNPEGRHGAGAAKVARERFGAIYGQGEGLQGNAYAIPTKDLRVTFNRGFKSISPEQITASIRKMYQCARQNPHKRFMVAYRNTYTRSSSMPDLSPRTSGSRKNGPQRVCSIPASPA